MSHPIHPLFYLPSLLMVSMVKNTPKSQGIVATVCRYSMRTCVVTNTCQMFPPASGFRPEMVPQAGFFHDYSAFTECLVLLTEVLNPRILVLLEISSQTKGLKTIYITVIHLKRLLRRAWLFPLLICVLIIPALPLSGSCEV